jgi:predicted Rossmann fold flavoprotein
MSSSHSTETDVIVIGAGAAGLMCAIEAGKRGRSVTVLEHNDAVGKKIRISGGGRCNFTNIHASPDNYLSLNPHFIKSPLSRYTPQDFCALIHKYKIAFHEKKLGQLFCDKSSQEIISLLKKECDCYGVHIVLGAKVTEIQKKDNFELWMEQGKARSESLVIATGALSIPMLGATDFGYKVAKQFGLKINPCRPGLVPLTFSEKDLNIFKDLSGVSVDAIVSFDKIQFRENILFTHRGLSGPAILQISSYWQPGKAVTVNLLPELQMSDVLESHRSEPTTLKTFLKNRLPSRLIDALCEHFLGNKPINQYSSKQLKDIARLLNSWEVIPKGTEGYAKAEVTVGGVDTDELSSKTMESKKVPGLFFIGEIVDITGHLGGYNFQWAWASGHAAGQFV